MCVLGYLSAAVLSAMHRFRRVVCVKQHAVRFSSKPWSDEWARAGLGATRAEPHETLNRLLFVQTGFGW